jgi:hypothetical protein
MAGLFRRPVEPWHDTCRQIATGGLHCPDLAQRRQALFGLGRCLLSGPISHLRVAKRSGPSRGRGLGPSSIVFVSGAGKWGDKPSTKPPNGKIPIQFQRHWAGAPFRICKFTSEHTK